MGALGKTLLALAGFCAFAAPAHAAISITSVVAFADGSGPFDADNSPRKSHGASRLSAYLKANTQTSFRRAKPSNHNPNPANTKGCPTGTALGTTTAGPFTCKVTVAVSHCVVCTVLQIW